MWIGWRESLIRAFTHGIFRNPGTFSMAGVAVSDIITAADGIVYLYAEASGLGHFLAIGVVTSV